MTKYLIALSAGAVTGYAAASLVSDVRNQMKTKTARAEALKEIDAIMEAVDVVTGKIINGEYQGRTYKDMNNDYEFYKMAARAKE